ncbi:MAG: peptidylprolyl isomerase [Bryobacteraceae bacterium]|nr:peptidylprolyl isomerase [Bryobacteraceae bacterium]
MHRLTSTLIAAFLCVSATATAAIQQPPAESDDPVVVVIEGQPWRRSEIEGLINRLPPNVAQNFLVDRRNFLVQYALMQRLAAMAEKEGVADSEPHRTRLAYQRSIYLAQAAMDQAAMRIQIQPEEQKRYFEEHKQDFSRAQVRVIYLSFNDNPPPSKDPKAKRPRTSAEAGKLARELVAKARAGADFATLARQFSDDEETRGKGGEFRPVKPNDQNLPPEIRTAIFSLRPGQVSDPVRQTGGFWIFRLEDYTEPAFEEVQSEIFDTLREARFREWIESVQKSLQIEFRDESYLGGGSPKQ